MCPTTKQGGSVMIAGEQIECSGGMTWGVSGGSRGGAGGPPPLVLDQTEARRAEKMFCWDRPPLLSQGLMTGPSSYLKVWIRHWEYYKLERGPRRTYQTHIGKARQLLFDAEIDIVVYVTDN